MNEDFGMKSIIRIGVNNRNELVLDNDYHCIGNTGEDRELLYLLIGAMERVKMDLLELTYQQDEQGATDEEEDSEDFNW